MAYTLKFAQLQATTLAGSGAAIGATSIVLTSFTTIDGVALAMTDFGSIGYGTLEPDAGTQEEMISFSGITQNSNGTATLTGVKHVLDLNPHTQTSGTTKVHAGGVNFVISNTSAMYQTIIDYIDGIAVAGSPDMTTTAKGIGEEATAAEIDAGTQTGGTSAELVVNPKYLKDSIYYTRLPSPDEKDALDGTSTPSASNKYVTEETLTGKIAIIRSYAYASSPVTWTKPTGLLYIDVELWGGGGSGASSVAVNGRAAGGGGGAYAKATLFASQLGTTETITIGAGGASVTDNFGNSGGNTTFGSLLTAYGGAGGSRAYNAGNTASAGGGGGMTSAGSVSSGGGPAIATGTDPIFSGGNGGTTSGGSGVGSIYGGGGGASAGNQATGTGGNSTYGGGGGGGGGASVGEAGNGGSSVFGGNGGNGATQGGTATAGAVPSGGGGGRGSGTGPASASGAGGNGQARIIEHYM
jgi:hypothetical protein